MTEIVNNNQDIYIQYKHMERLLPGYFSFDNELKMPLNRRISI